VPSNLHYGKREERATNVALNAVTSLVFRVILRSELATCAKGRYRPRKETAHCIDGLYPLSVHVISIFRRPCTSINSNIIRLMATHHQSSRNLKSLFRNELTEFNREDRRWRMNE
jgi:hypothetical protein